MAKQKKRPNLPLDNRVARCCGSQRLDRDPVSGAVRGIIPQALMLRPDISEQYLSTSWLEHYPGTDEQRLKAVAAAKRRAGRDLRPNSAIALLRVGHILSAGEERSHVLRVTHRATRVDPAYAKIEGMPLDNSDSVLLLLLCTQACQAVHLLKDIDALED